MTEPSPTFVGRAPELESLGRALSLADGGQPQFVLVSAPAGLGKTALVDRALTGVAHRLLRVGADERSSSGAIALGQLSPELGPVTRWPLLASGAITGGSNVAVGAELVSMLGDLEPDQLVVLLVEDAQWLDSASAGAIQFALRRLTVERAAVLVTTRGGVRSVDLGWQRPAQRPGFGRSVELGALTEAEVGALAASRSGRRLPIGAVVRLTGQTGGHPLHVRILVESTPWEQLAAASGPLPVPRTLAETVAAALTGMSAAGRRVVAVTAVLGQPSSLRLLRTVAGIGDLSAAITEAAAVGLVRASMSPLGPSVGVTHPLVATTVREVLEPAERHALDAAVLPFLSGDAALRHRIAITEGYDEALAAEVEVAGIERERADEYDAAVGLLLAAADLSGDPQLRARRFLRAVALMTSKGDVVRAFGCQPEVLASPPSCERTAVLAALALLSGQLERSSALLAQARSELPAGGGERVAASIDLLTATRKVVTGVRGDDEVARVLANPAALPAWRQLARVLGAISHVLDDQPSEALDLLALPRGIGLPLDPLDVPVLAVRGAVGLWTGDPAAAMVDLALVEDHIHTGRPVYALLPLSLALAAEAQLATGRWLDAVSTVDVLLAVEEGESRALERPIAHAVAARVLTEHGEHERAGQQLDAARMWSEILNSPSNRVYVALAAATMSLRTGDPADALDALRAVHEPHLPFRRWERRLLQAQALAALGQLAAAESLARSIAGRGGHLGAEAQVVVAEVCLLRGDLVMAEAELRAAATAIPGVNSHLRAREAQLRGELAIRTGHPDAGSTAISVARRLFADLGAWPRVAQCDQRLAELRGDAPPTGPRLSDRELEVARLVALGLSNAEAAARLYVSRKAIEFHLTNVYGKLGISSRRELASRFQAGAASTP